MKDKIIRFRVTVAQDEKIRKNADIRGISITEYISEKVFATTETVAQKKIKESIGKLCEVYSEFNKFRCFSLHNDEITERLNSIEERMNELQCGLISLITDTKEN